jgi:glycine cleavage system regulatory protein
MLRRQVVSALARRMATPSIATGAQVARFASAAEQSRRHVIAALVVNQPGCLAEIANMFAARGYNIDSLVDQSVVNVSGQDGSSHWSVMLGSVADDAPCDALYR